uniref:Uncharacterized protein n=1 Tax=Panagrolaimus sp. ES5 TaxID=591445 RepID=A0AC34GFJ3_9BILA
NDIPSSRTDANKDVLRDLHPSKHATSPPRPQRKRSKSQSEKKCHQREKSPSHGSRARYHSRSPSPRFRRRETSPPMRLRYSRSRSPPEKRPAKRYSLCSRSLPPPIPKNPLAETQNTQKSLAQSIITRKQNLMLAEYKSLLLPNPADFMICNEWTPMYISFLKVPPAIGEVAKADLNVNPEGVIYDICKFISIPFKDIQINPEWAFNVACTGQKIQQTVLEVQTWKGIHAVDPINVLALIFIGLHKEAERVTGKAMKKVFVKKTNPV